MINEECFVCKKHYTQGGRCSENRINCLLFDKELRGKKIRGTFRFVMDRDTETKVIKPLTIIQFIENGREFEAEVIKINHVDMEKWMMSIDVDYYELEMPKFEKKKLFKVVNT